MMQTLKSTRFYLFHQSNFKSLLSYRSQRHCNSQRKLLATHTRHFGQTFIPMASFEADTTYRHEATPFDTKVDAQVYGQGSDVIHALTTSLPELKIYTRASPRYETLRNTYNKLVKSQPLVICRPTNVTQIQGIVRVARQHGAPLGVRSGGHDVWGRSCIADSVTIDMREMDTQKLAEDKQTAKIGGGVTSDNFIGFLDTHGLCTAQGLVGSVGWTGWAVWGGYGPFSDYVGFGLDNITAAKVVTAEGELVEADSELLWGIKGGGGNLGIIVESTVNVHPMPKILAGFIGYDWAQATQVLLGLQQLLDQGVPDALCVQVGFMKTEWGLGITLIFIWPDTETLADGKKWLETIRGLGSVVVDTVEETKFKDFQKITSEPVTERANVCSRSASIRKFTPATVKQLLAHIETIPDIRQYNAVAHILHGKCTKPNPSSSFATREPHILFHINGCEDDEPSMPEAISWVDGLVAKLKSTGELMKPVYVSFMGEDEGTEQTFGDNWDRLVELKKKVDGTNTFKFSQPKLLGSVGA